MIALESVMEAFEEAHATHGSAVIEDFLPDRGHPEYAAIVCELIRVDLEYAFERGNPPSLADYQHRFPDILADRTRLEQVAFEEFRLRRQAGEPVTPRDYAQHYGIALDDWPPGESRAGDNGIVPPGGADPCLPAASMGELEPTSDQGQFPEPWQKMLGFQLVRELGRGAFARVYLARQVDLSHRLVALKVTTRFTSEPHWLSQLQHTNIVPIYSLHRVHGLEVVCMPYLGATTFASLLAQFRDRSALPATGEELAQTIDACNDVTRASNHELTAPRGSRAARVAFPQPSPAFAELCCRLSYVDAVVWLLERVARGLEHAHRRRIVHRDLKPANLLLAEHGEPMILDFNLAADDTLDGMKSDTAGGTLPYMAPEQLEMLTQRPVVDARCDVYSMGVILFEMLTGQLPFRAQSGPVETQLPILIADRRAKAPLARRVRPDVPRDVDSIIQQCLAPDPDQRYASASQLREDLQRHLEHRPLRYAPDRSPRDRLRKWMRRHPRMASASSVAMIASTVLLLLTGSWSLRGHRLARLEAREQLSELEQAVDAIRAPLTSIEPDAPLLQEGMAAGLAQLERYHLLSDADDWTTHPAYDSLDAHEQQRLRERLAEILYLMADAAQHESLPLNDSRQRDEQLGKALRYCRLAMSCGWPSRSHAPRALLLQEAELLEARGAVEEAAWKRKEAARGSADTLMDHFLMAAGEARKGHYAESISYLKRVCNERPRDFAAWFLLGNCRAGLGKPRDAEGCFTTAIALAPMSHWGYYHRGLARLELMDFAGAEEDFSEVLTRRPRAVSAWLNRAIARQGRGDVAGAVQDLTSALEAGGPSRIFFLRARYWKQLGRHASAARDLEEGLRRTPTDEKSWIARGIARLKMDPQKALEDFETAKKFNPRSVSARHNMAHVLAEQLGRNEEAIDVLGELLTIRPGYVEAVAARGVIRARIGLRDEAHKDARAALKLNRDARTLYQVACIYALTSRREPADTTQALRLLSGALRGDLTWSERAMDDPDLEPLRNNPEFQSLLSSARNLIEIGESSDRGDG